MRHYVSVLCALLMAAGALAVSPTTVEHSTEADFATGATSGVVVTSEGRLQLGRELAVRMSTADAPAIVSALATDGKIIYVASGSENTIYKIDGDKSVPFATVEGTIVTSLLWTGKELLAGTSGGDGAGVYAVDDKGGVKAVWSDEDVQYVWAILRDGAGRLYVATGPKARVYVVDGGKGDVLYEVPSALAKNILCLARERDGTLYAGTDTSGLVLCIDPEKKTGRVILNATEKEVSAIVLDGRGGLYAATSDAARATGEVARGGAAGGGPAFRGAADDMDEMTNRAPVLAVVVDPADDDDEACDCGECDGDEDGDEDEEGVVAKPADAKPVVAPVTRSAVAVAAGRGPGGGASPAADGPGNAVYHIDADGLARAIFRQGVSILAMIRVDNALILGTGNNGQIFRLALDSDETVMLADAESSQITALTQAGGQIYFGTANKGSVGMIGASHARTGTFTAKAIDAQQIARWGTVRFWSSAPEGASVTVSTRTGNTAEPDDKTWSEWSAPAEAKAGFMKVASPAGRFLQYRLTFAGDGSATASAGDVRLVYQVANLAPVISAVQVVGGEGAGGARANERGATPPGISPTAARIITIQASDPNNDQLVYTIEYREVGTSNWIVVAEKLEQPMYVWDTQTVGDGDYELRVTASDAPANPPDKALTASKITKVVRVDNTAPVVKDFVAQVVDGKDGEAASIRGSGTAVDDSRIAAIHYSLDSSTEWVAVSPDSGLCADAEEKFSFTIKNIKPGNHRVTVRATDAVGNMGYASVTVNVGK
ncbi:MAG: hypothetical protein FWE88_03980 [Phycisphaerae bacterium]|nr:hypothetical protein [Phycisphaerae bacterium]